MIERGKWGGLVASLVVLGCSGADTAGNRTGANGTQPSNGATPTAGTATGSAGAGSFGNSTAKLPTSTGTLPQQPQMMNTPTMSSGLTPMNIDQCSGSNAAGLSAADTATLIAGGSPGMLRVLYPYDGTIFPRGLLAPTLMWDGAPADAVYVHMKASAFEYKGCLKPSADGQVQLPDDVWSTAGLQTKGSSDPYLVELSVISGGAVTGPVSLHVTIAQATIKGSIYYNSYTSALAAAALGSNITNSIAAIAAGGMNAAINAGIGGVVLRIPPGGTAEVFTSQQCNGCHSVSANGSRMVDQGLGTGGWSYMIAPDSQPNPMQTSAGPRGAFGALYPDGSVYLTTSVVIEVARASLTTAGGLLGGTSDATLYRTDDGSEVPNTGIPTGALMPSFSPDGKLLVFNDYAINEAHGLGLMQYDVASNTASNYRMLYMDSDTRPAWPFVLPDDNGVVFTRTDGTDFSGEGAGLAGSNIGPTSDMFIADIKSGTVTILAKAMGYAMPADATNDNTYLPFGADDLHKSYFPTLSPVAAGGYFWLFFDSVRHYGNLGLQRQLWGAAIDIASDGNYALDPSHPPFYLPGQEFGTGNHRAFAALDPCRKEGDSCTSGTDCCGGFCYVEKPDSEFDTEAKGSCTMHTPMCSNTNEHCTSSADCCAPAAGQPANACIAGFCAVVHGPE